MAHRIFLTGVCVGALVACGEPPWTEDCLSEVNATYEAELGEEFCIELGMNGGIAGRIPDSRVEGSALTRIDEYTTQRNSSDCRDCAETTFHRFEAVERGEATVLVVDGEVLEFLIDVVVK